MGSPAPVGHGVGAPRPEPPAQSPLPTDWAHIGAQGLCPEIVCPATLPIRPGAKDATRELAKDGPRSAEKRRHRPRRAPWLPGIGCLTLPSPVRLIGCRSLASGPARSGEDHMLLRTR